MKILKVAVFLCMLLGGWITTGNAMRDEWHLPINEGKLPFNEYKELSIEEEIRLIAQEEKFKWPDYLVRLADCESKLGKYSYNKQGNYPQDSIDRGVFMINNYWHAEVSDEQAHNLDWATRWTISRINNGFQHEWSCDKFAKR
jgi:hypothetical protein